MEWTGNAVYGGMDVDDTREQYWMMDLLFLYVWVYFCIQNRRIYLYAFRTKTMQHRKRISLGLLESRMRSIFWRRNMVICRNWMV